MSEYLTPIRVYYIDKTVYLFARAIQENFISFAAVAEAFLSDYLGGRYEPIRDDFEGLSITVPLGSVYMPGLIKALPK